MGVMRVFAARWNGAYLALPVPDPQARRGRRRAACRSVRRFGWRADPLQRRARKPRCPDGCPLGSDYHIAPMDTISVKVFKSQDLTGDYQVDLTGHFSMPLVARSMRRTSRPHSSISD